MTKLLSTLALAGLLVLTGCGNDKEEVQVNCNIGHSEAKGNVSFWNRSRGITYIDEGYDGTLDRIHFSKDGKHYTLTKDDSGFEDYISGYLEARRIAAEGE